MLITECSFPSELQQIADVSLHLTPVTLASELTKVDPRIPVRLYHFKPAYLDALRAELASLKFQHDVQELQQDAIYTLLGIIRLRAPPGRSSGRRPNAYARRDP